ncbi:VWA domain-containing protein [bacterium]|nr:VWA domain-containing protein [candidate division CSSED10-310 bacterium]
MDYRVQITVSLVHITASVTDHRGLTVFGLEKEDFEIYENGVLQNIAYFENARGLPKQILILLDVSGSMRILDKISAAKGAIEILINVLHPEDRIKLVVFADGELEEIANFESSKNSIIENLWKVRAFGKTALRDAVIEAPKHSKIQGTFQRCLLLISDGMDNASEMTLHEAIESARAVDLPIYSIGIDPLKGETVAPQKNQLTALKAMQTLSEETGGRFFHVKSSAEIQSALDNMIRDLENQYLMGFISNYSEQIGEHKITVKCKKWRCTVRARKGYFVDN